MTEAIRAGLNWQPWSTALATNPTASPASRATSPPDQPPLLAMLRTLTVAERRWFVSGAEVVDAEMIISRIKRPYQYHRNRAKSLKKRGIEIETNIHADINMNTSININVNFNLELNFKVLW